MKLKQSGLCIHCAAQPPSYKGSCRACYLAARVKQRERRAARRGKTYRTLPTVKADAGMKAVEDAADQLRARWARAWLKMFADEPRSKTRAYLAAKTRRHYSLHSANEVERVRVYKTANVESNRRWNDIRLAREARLADGTVTRSMIARLKREASHCAYCNCQLVQKQTDHIVSLAAGGEHSLRNIVIVCPDCNQHKHALDLGVWINRIDQPRRERIAGLFEARFGVRLIAA